MAPLLNKILRVVGLAALGVCAAGLASATSVTYIEGIDYVGAFQCADETNASCYSPTAWSTTGANTISLKGFNTSLGSLTKVTLNVSGFVYGTYRIQNNSAQTASFGDFNSAIDEAIVKTGTATPYTVGIFPATASTNGSVFATLRPQLFDIPSSSLPGFYDSGTVSYATLLSPSSDSAAISLCATTGCSSATNNQPLSQFYSATTVSLPVYADVVTNLIAASGGNLVVSTTTNAMLRVDSITYTYTPGAAVPEPGVLVMMGSGLIGLVAARRRLRK